MLQEENAELKETCKALEKDNAKIKAQGSSAEMDMELRTEVSALRMDKECLEKKVRKFAMHCQRLEDDKAGMRDALRSCNIESIDDSDLSDEVIQLCDRLASAKENHAQQAAFLKQRDASHETEKKKLLREVQSLKEKLESSRFEIQQLQTSLQGQAGDGKEVEKLRKRIGHLEQEKLALMQDLKATKQELKKTKMEWDNARANSSDEPTIDFSAMAAPVPSSTARSTRSTRRTRSATTKEQVQQPELSSDTMELTQMALRAAGSQAPGSSRKSASSKKQSAKKRRPVLVESTNQGNTERVSEDASRKRPRREAASRSSRDPEQQAKRRTPGLGESSSMQGSASSETGECNQQ